MTRPVAVVTGASAGIGTEFARRLAERGYDLVLVARRGERLDALATELMTANAGANARSIVMDLAEDGAASRVAAELDAYGTVVELLVNNAGFGSHGAFVSSDDATIAGMLDVNIGVLVELTRALLPGMVERGRGGVINVASTAGFQPLPAMAVYGATKAFVLSFSAALHEEVRRSGVRVVALCPGATSTEFFDIAGEKASVGPRRTASDVVRTALRAYDRNRSVVIDGAFNAILAESTRLAPRAFAARLGAKVLRAD